MTGLLTLTEAAQQLGFRYRRGPKHGQPNPVALLAWIRKGYREAAAAKEEPPLPLIPLGPRTLRVRQADVDKVPPQRMKRR